MSVVELIYRLGADNTKFSRELKKAEKDVQRFSKRAESQVKKLGKAFAAMGGLAAGAMAGAVRETINFGTELSLMSDRTGLAVEEIGRLTFAAEQSDLSMSDLEKSIARMNRAVGEAASGTGRAADASRRYGIALRDSNGEIRSQNDLFLDIADAVQSAANAYEEAEIAASFFGSQGAQKLLPLLREGRDGIEEMGDEAERLGIVLDTQAADASRQLGDQLNVLRQRSRGLALTFGSQVVPVLNAYLGAVLESSGGTDKLADRARTVQRTFGAVLKIVESVRASFLILGQSIGMAGAIAVNEVRGMADQLREFGSSLSNFARRALARDFAGAVDAMRGTSDRMNAHTIRTADATAAIWADYRDDVTDILGESVRRIVAIDRAGSEAMAESTRQLATANAQTWSGMVDTVDEELKRLQGIVGRALDDLRTPLDRFTADLADLDAALARGLISDEQFDLLEQRLLKMHDPFGELAAKAEADAKRIEEAMRMEGLAEAAERVRAEINGVDLRLQAHLASLEELRDEGLLTWEEYAIAVEKANGAIDELDEVAEESADLMQSVAENFASSFIDFVLDPFNANVEEMATNFIRQITRMVIETAAQRAIIAAFGGEFSSGGAVSAGGGGSVLGMATGGFVSGPGTSTSDSIPALLSDGEYVLSARTVRRLGVNSLNAVNFGNAKGFATGGLVGGGGGSSAPSVSVHMHGSQEEAALAALQSSAGRSLVIDIIGQNRRQVQRLLQ